jgi:outer membrane protein TolC
MRWKRRLAWMAMVGLMLAGSLEAQGGPLDGLVREALESSRAVEQARLAVRQQDASVREASGMLGPSVTVHARYSESTGTINFGDLVNPAYQALNQITGTGRYPTDVDARLPLAQETKVSVVQPLFQPALSSNARIQRNLRELRGASLRGAIRSLAAEVQLAYLSYARSVRAVELYRETLSLLQENVRVNESLLANGKMTPDALFRARAEKSGMEQQLLETDRESAAARRYLNLLLERPLDAKVELLPDSVLDFPLRLTLEEALLSARERREELEQVNLRVRVAEVERRLAKASYLPSVSLALDYGIQGSDYRFDAEHDFAVLSVVTQWNAFNGGQTAARGERAALEARSASTRHEELEREIMLQVQQAYDATTVAYSAIATAEDRLVAARRTYELVERRYREGMAPHIEYVQARTEYTTAALNRILTGYQYALRYVELERAAALREVEP